RLLVAAQGGECLSHDKTGVHPEKTVGERPLERGLHLLECRHGFILQRVTSAPHERSDRGDRGKVIPGRDLYELLRELPAAVGVAGDMSRGACYAVIKSQGQRMMQ